MKFATFSILFATLANVSLGLPNDGILTEEDKQALLDLHNTYRSQTALGNTPSNTGINHPPATNMQKMVWNEDLAEGARLHAAQCIQEDGSGFFGENQSLFIQRPMILTISLIFFFLSILGLIWGAGATTMMKMLVTAAVPVVTFTNKLFGAIPMK